MNTSTHLFQKTTALDVEWREAEQVDRTELLEAEVAALKAERDRLRMDLTIAQLWVDELALWVQELHTGEGDVPIRAKDVVLAPETRAALQRHEPAGFGRRRLLAVAAVATAPWAVLVAVAHVVSLAV